MGTKFSSFMDEDGQGGTRAWYVIHTYSGYENKVKANLESKIASQGLGDEIFNVVVPMEESDEVDHQGKKKLAKVFPGYVLVDMLVNTRSWYVVRNTQGVTGFVGSEKEPIPLSDEEAQRILSTAQKTTVKLSVQVGDTVRINGSWYDGYTGDVLEIDAEKGLLKISVSGTVVEVEASQVEKV